MTESPAESSSKPTNVKPRNRLSSEGIKILQDYWDKHPGKVPSIGVRKALTEEIKRIPGHDYYKVINATQWFKRRVEEFRNSPSFQADPRFPSLSAAVLEHLNVLLKNQPNPSPDVIKTWATLIAHTGASYQDVVTWAHTATLSSQADHLPTPANTASPEPSKPTFTPASASMSPTQSHYPPSAETQNMNLKKSPTHSPTLPSLSIRTSQSQASPPQWRPYYHPSPVSPASPVTPSSVVTSPSQRPRVPTLQEAIIQGVADAVVSPTLATPPDVLPSNAAEFNAMFALYETQLSQLMHALESS